MLSVFESSLKASQCEDVDALAEDALDVDDVDAAELEDVAELIDALLAEADALAAAADADAAAADLLLCIHMYMFWRSRSLSLISRMR